MFDNVYLIYIFLGDFMILNYIYAVVHLLPVNHFLSIEKNDK